MKTNTLNNSMVLGRLTITDKFKMYVKKYNTFEEIAEYIVKQNELIVGKTLDEIDERVQDEIIEFFDYLSEEYLTILGLVPGFAAVVLNKRALIFEAARSLKAARQFEGKINGNEEKIDQNYKRLVDEINFLFKNEQNKNVSLALMRPDKETLNFAVSEKSKLFADTEPGKKIRADLTSLLHEAILSNGIMVITIMYNGSRMNSEGTLKDGCFCMLKLENFDWRYLPKDTVEENIRTIVNRKGERKHLTEGGFECRDFLKC